MPRHFPSTWKPWRVLQDTPKIWEKPKDQWCLYPEIHWVSSAGWGECNTIKTMASWGISFDKPFSFLKDYEKITYIIKLEYLQIKKRDINQGDGSTREYAFKDPH